jgi:hypothetical protein
MCLISTISVPLPLIKLNIKQVPQNAPLKCISGSAPSCILAYLPKINPPLSLSLLPMVYVHNLASKCRTIAPAEPSTICIKWHIHIEFQIPLFRSVYLASPARTKHLLALVVFP